MAQIPEFEDVWRRIEGLVSSSNVGAASTSLSNGDDYSWKITVTNTAGAKILTELDTSLYLGSVSNDNQMGWGTVDLSNWQILGPWQDYQDTTGINSVWKVYVRNISAGASQTVLLRVQARSITNTRTVGTST